MGELKNDVFSKIAAYIFLTLIAYLPFHIFISIVVGVNVGYLGPLKAGKDLAIGVLAILLVPYFVHSWRQISKQLLGNWLGITCLSYIALNLLFFAIDRRDLDAVALGLVYNTRFIVIFLLAGILSQAQPRYINVSVIVKIIVATGTLVAVFGILQYFVLPKDFFAKLGYSMQSGAIPWFYIDDKPDFLRIMSTMRDPNSLGSYLLIPISILLAKLQIDWKKLRKNTRIEMISLIVVLVVALILAFSRSGLLGLMVVIVTSFVLTNTAYIQRNTKIVLLGAILIVGATTLTSAVFMKTHPRSFKNIVFHADEETVLRDPNELRIDFLKRSVNQITAKPYGDGLGTAGLASMKNDIKGVNLTENYYLQLGIEIGVVGLVLFLAACMLLLVRIYGIWSEQHTYVGLALITSFSGLFITNMLAHVWSNETVAVTWWGLAGIFIGQALLNVRRKPNSHNGKLPNKTM